ncbi:MAG TPA: response regulator [Melioribacteraceae bacterium]|nr:response regulator [Melioribacteraceae bacterium]
MEKEKPDWGNLLNFSDGIKNIFISIIYKNGEGRNFFSNSIFDITGYQPDEINSFSEKIYSIVCEEDLPLLKKKLAQLESDSSLDSGTLNFRIVSKSGIKIWLQESLKLIRDHDGEIVEKRSTFFDITELKEKELKIEKSNTALIEQNSAKDKFISIISHDLRAPFTTLLGFSEILLNEKDLSEDEKLEYLKYIYDASKTQLNLINCLLDWSRLQTGRIKIDPMRLNVKSAVAAVITPLTGDAVRKNIDIKFDIPADLFMNADERLIGQAIVNLASNAIKYTPDGKEIYIHAQRFKDGMIEIIVRDQGLGIAEENKDKLFKIDQKFSLVGTNGEKGSGLGLTLMKEIVDKHGGHVWFYSQVGEGSEFHFTVPEAKNCVLVVEDDPSVRALYKKVIEENLKNFDIVSVDNGYEAIGILKNLLPTLIITDHDMPLMNGIQLVEALNKRESSRSIPVIVVSAKLTDEISKAYSRLGVNKIIPKPLELNLLLDTMQEVIF